MKKIYFIRHANSPYDSNDKSRPLDSIGIAESLLLGRYINESKINPDAIFSSSAYRTSQTIDTIAQEAGIDKKIIQYSDLYYTFKSTEIITLIRQTQDVYKSIFIVGHNPAMLESMSYLSSDLRSFPTCALSILSFNSKWEDLSRKSCELELFITPDDLQHIYSK